MVVGKAGGGEDEEGRFSCGGDDGGGRTIATMAATVGRTICMRGILKYTDCEDVYIDCMRDKLHKK
jgi:hypothetical protein